MAKPLGNPCLRDAFGKPLGPDELARIRAVVTEELVAAATSRRPDIGFIRSLAKVARTIDRRIEMLADREQEAPSVQRRQQLAAEARSYNTGGRHSRPIAD